jgi:hypothetical protein
MSATAGYVAWLTTRIERATERAAAGERFDHIATPAFGLLAFEEHTGDESGRAAQVVRAARAAGVVPLQLRAKIVIPASDLIRDTVARLGEG